MLVLSPSLVHHGQELVIVPLVWTPSAVKSHDVDGNFPCCKFLITLVATHYALLSKLDMSLSGISTTLRAPPSSRSTQ